MEKMPDYVDARYSKGMGKAGKIAMFLRPNYKCFNRSRKVSGFSNSELIQKARKVIDKWYAPKIILYRIDGNVIASNSEENALKEYWRVCEIDFVKYPFPVYLHINQIGNAKPTPQ